MTAPPAASSADTANHATRRPREHARRSEDKGLRQQLRDKATRGRTQRTPGCKLLKASRTVHQQKIGEVGGGNQENDPHGRRQHLEQAIGAADEVFPKEDDPARPISGTRLRIRLSEFQETRLELGVRLSPARPGREAADQPQELQGRVRASRILFRNPGRDELGLANLKREVGPQDAHDRERLAVEPEAAPEDVVRPAESSLPQPVADENRRSAFPAGIGRRERPSERDVGAEHLTVVPADAHGLKPLRVTAVRQIDAPLEIGGHAVERPRRRGEIQEHR